MKRLTPTQQRAQIKHVVLDIERTANLLIAVKNGTDPELAEIAERYQRDLLTTARSLKIIHDAAGRAREGRDDAGDVAAEVIAAYQEDQQARLDAMERVALDLQTVLDAATPNDEWPVSYTVDADDVEVLSESLAIMLAALDATEQEHTK